MSRPWPESLVGQVLTIRGATHLCLAAGEDALLLLQLARCDGALFRRGDPVQYIVAHGPCLHGDELVWRQGAYYPLLGYKETERVLASVWALADAVRSMLGDHTAGGCMTDDTQRG